MSFMSVFKIITPIGADLVGKVESNIPEDDPRNPAVIADNVGDNVGDVAGMGADLFESYVGSIIAAATLGSQFFGSVGVAAPFYLSASGILCSIIGSSLVSVNSSSAWWPLNYLVAPFRRHDRTHTTHDTTHDMEQSQMDEEHAPDVNPATQSSLLMAIRRGIFGAALLNILLGALILFLLFDPLTQAWAIFLCFLIGIASGVLIGLATEYCTSFAYRPTKSIAESGLTGAAPVIIKGLSVGMLSTVAPVVIIVLSIIFSVLLGDFASGGKSGGGIYGIAIAAVGMLSTLGVTLATDAYGPIADNGKLQYFVCHFITLFHHSISPTFVFLIFHTMKCINVFGPFFFQIPTTITFISTCTTFLLPNHSHTLSLLLLLLLCTYHSWWYCRDESFTTTCT